MNNSIKIHARDFNRYHKKHTHGKQAYEKMLQNMYHWENKIKTTIRWYYTPIKMAKFWTLTSNAGEDIKQ